MSKGTCNMCGQTDLPLKKDGTLRRHWYYDKFYEKTKDCAGGGNLPAEAIFKPREEVNQDA